TVSGRELASPAQTRLAPVASGENGHASAAEQPAHTELSAEEYKAVFRRHPAGVAVVTLVEPVTRELVGFTATSVISVSADPPVLAFSVLSTSSSWPALQHAPTVVVNFLGYEQVSASQRFATSGIDRFDGVAFHQLATGEPVLDGALTWVRGVVAQRLPVGESHLVTVHAVESDSSRAGTPLIYHDRQYHALGGDYQI